MAARRRLLLTFALFGGLVIAGCSPPAPAAVPTASGFAPASLAAADSAEISDCMSRNGRAEQANCLLPIAEDLLGKVFAPVTESRDREFVAPRIITEDGGATTSCGAMTKVAYCPGDRVIVVPLDSLATLGDRAARDVDWSAGVLDYFRGLLNPEQMSVSGHYGVVTALAHEYAHHVQNLIGYVDVSTAEASRRPDERAEQSSELELTADCMAGWFAGASDASGAYGVTPEDQWAAVTALAEVGDDFRGELRGGSADAQSVTTFEHGASDERSSAWVAGVGMGLDGKEPFAACLEWSRSALLARTSG